MNQYESGMRRDFFPSSRTIHEEDDPIDDDDGRSCVSRLLLWCCLVVVVLTSVECVGNLALTISGKSMATEPRIIHPTSFPLKNEESIKTAYLYPNIKH